MKITSEIFEKKLFILFLLVTIIILAIKIIGPTIGTWGINKTVGWAYDLTTPNLIITFAINIISTITYFVLFLFKKKTNKILSIIQIILFSLVSFLYIIIDPVIILFLNGISIIIFLMNIIWTLNNRIKH